MFLYKFASSARERELLGNVKRSLEDCLVRVKVGELQESLRILLIGIDALANLEARLSGKVTTEKEAARNNHKRFVDFLRKEIPEWKEHEMQWDGRTIQLDLSEMSYEIRCKHIHEYSDLSTVDFPVRLKWDHRLYSDPVMWIYGRPTSKVVDRVDLNGFSLLNRLVQVLQKYIGIFGSTGTCFCGGINPYAIYELLGTVQNERPLNKFGLHSDNPEIEFRGHERNY